MRHRPAPRRSPTRTRLRLRVLAACLCGAAGVAATAAAAAQGAACPAATPQGRTVVDMAGRSVTVPARVARVATVGSVPVLNGYFFALGAGDRIANGLPSRFTATGRWRLHDAIAPHLAERPVLQGQANSEVSLETLVRLAPDIVVTMDRARLQTLETAKLPVVYLEWGSAPDVQANVRLLGCVLDRTARAEEYLRYFDDTTQRVRRALEGLPPSARPKVLYFSPRSMSTPLLIANWWIEEAGGRSVTAGLGQGGNVQYTHETLLMWNPDVLIVQAPEQVEEVYRDERFSGLAAVRQRRVHVTPMGAHSWGQRTVEQPLTVLWAAGLLHPARFPARDLEAEIRAFYRRFFGYALSDEQIRALLEGRS